jgi:hypothetical protein
MCMNVQCSHRAHACMRMCAYMCMEGSTQVLNAKEPPWPPQAYRVHLPTQACVMPVCSRGLCPSCVPVELSQPVYVFIRIRLSVCAWARVIVHQQVCVLYVRTRMVLWAYTYHGCYMYACMYVCMHICRMYIFCAAYICVYACILDAYKTHTHTRTHTHARTHARATLGAIGAYLHHVCRTVQAFVCMRVVMLMCLCIYVFVCARVCPTYAYTCMCAYVLCAGMYAWIELACICASICLDSCARHTSWSKLRIDVGAYDGSADVHAPMRVWVCLRTIRTCTRVCLHTHYVRTHVYVSVYI